MCTALIVNEYLNNRFELWAIAAAFGDNLINVAHKRAEELNLDEQLTNFITCGLSSKAKS